MRRIIMMALRILGPMLIAKLFKRRKKKQADPDEQTLANQNNQKTIE